MIRPFSNRAIRYKSMVSVLISVGFMMSPGLSHAESVLRVATTMADVPLTTGQPSQGGEGQRFIGYTLYDGLVGWDLIDILPSLSLTLGPKGQRKGIPTVFSPQGLTHLGGFLLLATLLHRSLHRRTGRVPPLKY